MRVALFDLDYLITALLGLITNFSSSRHGDNSSYPGLTAGHARANNASTAFAWDHARAIRGST